METAGETAARIARGVARGLQSLDDYALFTALLKSGTEDEVRSWGCGMSVKRPVLNAIEHLDFRTLFNNRASY